MRHDKAENLLRLCTMMAARSQGVTLAMIQEEFDVSRRTAERMRDAACRLLPETQERLDDDGIKHWHATNIPAGLIASGAADISALKAAADMMRTANRNDTADRLRALTDKLMALQGRKRQLRLEPDLELLMQSEGLALHPGPRINVPAAHVETIRAAILSARRLQVSYARSQDRTPRSLLLEPYGLLFGPRPYLVAKQAGMPAVRHYRLQGLSKIGLSSESFERDSGFDLDHHRRQLFGVFNEDPFDVCWRFAPEAAAEAADYLFHPDQHCEHLADGALLVRFRAAGALEMTWHLYQWGDKVEVLEPARLRDMVAGWQRSDFEALP